VRLRFTGELWYWKGPSPFHFVSVPDEECAELHAVSHLASYGWGVIPVLVQTGSTSWTTSLFPRDGGYVVPIKTAVRRAEGLELGDTVEIALTVVVEP